MRRFLEYTVKQTLAGQSSSLKEYTIGLNVYDKSADFDPRLDALVRVEATRLRVKLRTYYDKDGREDPIVISLPTRSYKPVFRLSGAPRATVRRGSSDTEAQRLYLKGRYHWNKRHPGDINQAIGCFKAALVRHPRFALALAGLADCYASLAFLESAAPAEAWREAEQAALSALAENAMLSQAHTTLACMKALYRWEWQEAEDDFRRAIALDDRYATAHHWYAMFCLARQRRLEEALLELTRARELDPTSAIISCHLGQLFYFRRRYRDAAAQLRESIELDPTLPRAYWHLGFVYARLAEWSEARAAFIEGLRLSNEPAIVSGLRDVEALSGRREEAEDGLAQLDRLAASRYVSPVSMALIHAALGNTDEAFQRLRRALDERSPRAVHLKVDPAFDSLKTDNRFLKLLSELKI
jgi:tetratricopeptide (TPR) repeat protein